MSGPGSVLVAYDRTDTQGVADSVVKYLRRDHGYEVMIVGPGHDRRFEELGAAELRRARFFLELDAISGVLYHTEGLERLACPKLAWFVDTHKKPFLHQRIAPEFDLVFFTMWAWGGILGDHARWLPAHYDADLIGPRAGIVPDVDVGFVGSQPHERTRALQEIARRHGLSLLLETTSGPREKERTAELYARCRIVFNRHVGNDLNFRLFEAQGCRRLLLTDAQRNGQYELFKDREHVVYYKDDADLEELLLYYLSHEAERERIAAAGHALVSRDHTTAVRVRELVAAAEALVRERGGPPASPAQVPPRRALLLTRDYSPARGERPLQVARELAEGGAVVTVATLDPAAVPSPGIEVHAGPGADSPEGSGPAAETILANIPLLCLGARLLEEGRFDLAIAIGWENALATRILCERARLPYTLVLDQVPGEGAAEGYAREASRWACAGAATVLVPDERARTEAIQRLGAAPEKTRSAPRGLLEGSAPPAEVRYDHAYMLRNEYCVRSPEQARLNRIEAQVIERVLAPRRALVAGCAAGELVKQLLERGIDAWGFDLAEGLSEFVYEEVRDRVLRFDVTALDDFPYPRTGGRFDTLVAIDLFEHVEEEEVDRMLDGIARHFDQLALVISSSPVFEGHVCVKPFPWWLARLEARGYELLPEPSSLRPEEVGTYGVARFEGVKEDMSEQLVFFRAKHGSTRRRPKVSIGIVSCDRLDCLQTTIESTRRSLANASFELEWLAYDNGSSQPVRDYLARTGLDRVFWSERNVGLAPATDELYRASRGEYYLALEDDWRCLHASPAWLDLAVSILDRCEDVGVVRLRRLDDDQTAHWRRHRPEVALRHHPWSIDPLPAVVETRWLDGQRVYVAAAEYANWTNQPTLSRRAVRDWLGPFSSYLPDPRDHRPTPEHPGLEGAIDERWQRSQWRVAKLLDGPFTHYGAGRPALVGVGA